MIFVDFFFCIFVSFCCLCFLFEPRFVVARALDEHRRLRENGGRGLQHVLALSFSPGVTVEGLLLKAVVPLPGATPLYGQR